MRILFLGAEETQVFKWLSSITDTLFFESSPIGRTTLQKLAPDFIISHGYRHIINEEIVELFRGKMINLHISYLPWNRGADPNFWSVYDGTPKGVTIHLVDTKLDTGDILVQREVTFTKEDTLATSYNLLQQAVFNLFKETWQEIATGRLQATQQVGLGTYHNSQDKLALFEQYRISWDTPLSNIEVLKQGNKQGNKQGK